MGHAAGKIQAPSGLSSLNIIISWDYAIYLVPQDFKQVFKQVFKQALFLKISFLMFSILNQHYFMPSLHVLLKVLYC